MRRKRRARKKRRVSSWAVKTKGRASRLIESRILRVTRDLDMFTLRHLYYIMISMFSYPADKKFYRRLGYHVKKLRGWFEELHEKIVDPTRRPTIPRLAYPRIELWTEKTALANFLRRLAEKYKITVLALRGFPSLSMYHAALKRARMRGVTKILYVGDFDPSGLLIEEIAEKSMGITFERVALTWRQIRWLRPPSRPVNRKDSRTPDYIARFGERCWEVESVRPTTLLKIIESALRRNIPPEYLEEAQVKDKAYRIARPFAKILQSEAEKMLKEGITKEEIVRQIRSRYRIR